MAMTEMRTLRPKMPKLSNLDLTKSRFDFDRLSDTLYWDFYGEPRPAISYPRTDHVLYSVDPETEEVVGFQLDGFLARVVYEVPIFLELADVIGLTPEEVDEIRSKLDPETRARSAMRSLFGGLAADRPLAAVS